MGLWEIVKGGSLLGYFPTVKSPRDMSLEEENADKNQTLHSTSGRLLRCLKRNAETDTSWCATGLIRW